MPPSSLDSLLETHKVPCAVVATRSDAKWHERAAGLRDLERGLAVSVATPFEVGSLSKPVFACALLQLVAEGALGLDAPIAQVLASTELDDREAAEQITPRHLLTHTSGLPNWRPGRWTTSPGPLRLETEPGRAYRYSGEGFQLLQAIAETLSGQPLEPFMRERVLDPLGMSSSSYTSLPSYRAQLARGYTREGRPVPVFDARLADGLAAASLKATLSDLTRFSSANKRSSAWGSPAHLALSSSNPASSWALISAGR